MDRFFIENPRGGGFPGREGLGGREGVCGELGGGGLNFFFRGRNVHHVCCSCRNSGDSRPAILGIV